MNFYRYYHFGVVKALLDADLLPRVVTGTSGGALVAALLCTRTNAELKQLLVPELAHKITACQDDTWVCETSLMIGKTLWGTNISVDMVAKMVEDWGEV